MPSRPALTVIAKTPGPDMKLAPVTLDFRYGEVFGGRSPRLTSASSSAIPKLRRRHLGVSERCQSSPSPGAVGK